MPAPAVQKTSLMVQFQPLRARHTLACQTPEDTSTYTQTHSPAVMRDVTGHVALRTRLKREIIHVRKIEDGVWPVKLVTARMGAGARRLF
ncbi:hypothetical protein RRG08_054527 [Elysia crispata]|uniref:Uncharacterized protein n=1 Tax=Elysia crispata TaxID=231223 RepID=A0AAE1B983_9GAST|nr:hypothetical protein RRG08_054527 [Elysia crispata]